MDKKIIIIGAGPAGLAAAYRLQELGYKNWEVYEKNDYVGGLSASFKDARGFTWDIGGHVLFSRYEFFDEVLDKTLDGEILEYNRRAYIWFKNLLVPYPFQNHIEDLPEDVYSQCLEGLNRAQRNKVNSSNFKEWILHNFGEGIAKYFMFPHNWKLWAHPLDIMSADWTSGSISPINQVGSSWGVNKKIKYPLEGGIGQIFKKLSSFTDKHIRFKKEICKIDIKEKRIYFLDSSYDFYDVIVNTMPLDDFIRRADLAIFFDDIKELRHNGIYAIGFGIKGTCPKDRNWIYFPDEVFPFYRVSYISNYSPRNTPSSDYFSILTETSYSEFKSVSKDRILDETLQGLVDSNILTEQDTGYIASTFFIDVPYAYPVPTLGRDEVLNKILKYLRSRDVYSCGRFGGWRYEKGSMDDAVFQGKEVVDEILLQFK